MIRFIFLSVLVFGACESQGKPPPAPPVAPPPPAKPKVTDVTAQDYEAPKLPRGRVTLTDAFGGKHPVDVEIAATRDARTPHALAAHQPRAGPGLLSVG